MRILVDVQVLFLGTLDIVPKLPSSLSLELLKVCSSANSDGNISRVLNLMIHCTIWYIANQPY